MSRLWAGSEFRSLSSGKGRFVDQALAIVVKAADTLYPAGASPDEQSERGLNRVVERIASMSGSDPTLVAYLFFQRRQKGG